VGVTAWHSDYIINRKFHAGRITAGISFRSANSLMGRFGGGWNWKLGFQAGGNTIIISLLVLEIRFSYDTKLTYERRTPCTLK